DAATLRVTSTAPKQVARTNSCRSNDCDAYLWNNEEFAGPGFDQFGSGRFTSHIQQDMGVRLKRIVNKSRLVRNRLRHRHCVTGLGYDRNGNLSNSRFSENRRQAKRADTKKSSVVASNQGCLSIP